MSVSCRLHGAPDIQVDDLAEPLRRSGVTVHVRAEQLPGASSEVAAVLYRVARETLANVAKHSQASTVEVDLGPDRTAPTPTVVLRVADDGIGIRPEQDSAAQFRDTPSLDPLSSPR